MTHNTADIAAYIVELTERTPAKDRTVQIFDVAVEHKFPGVDIDQLYAAHDVAAATLKPTRRPRYYQRHLAAAARRSRPTPRR